MKDFLNAREKEFSGALNQNFRYEFDEEQDIYGIAVFCGTDTEPFTYLKSDQLGFCAPSSRLDHIYDVYLAQMDGDVWDVKRWIISTRTLGGSFLWPMEQDEDGGWLTIPEYSRDRDGTKPREDPGAAGSAGSEIWAMECFVCATGRKITKFHTITCKKSHY